MNHSNSAHDGFDFDEALRLDAIAQEHANGGDEDEIAQDIVEPDVLPSDGSVMIASTQEHMKELDDLRRVREEIEKESLYFSDILLLNRDMADLQEKLGEKMTVELNVWRDKRDSLADEIQQLTQTRDSLVSECASLEERITGNQELLNRDTDQHFEELQLAYDNLLHEHRNDQKLIKSLVDEMKALEKELERVFKANRLARIQIESGKV